MNPGTDATGSRAPSRLWAVVLPDVGMLRGSGRGYPEPFVASDKSLRIVSSIRLVRVAGRFAE